MYTDFSRVYDALMQDVDYGAWAAHYGALMKLGGAPEKARVAECACGSGSITLPLRRAGYAMTGLDLSEDMLEKAMEKARRAGLSIPFVCQDMTRLQLPRRADCILATCDGVNYLAQPGQPQAFFQAAYQNLKPGGLLIFDVSTPEKLKYTLGSNTLFSDEEEIAYIWQNSWDEEKQTVEMLLSIFEKEADGRYVRLEEQQLQRAHSRQELTDWLAQAGFSEIAFYGGFRMDDPSPGMTAGISLQKRHACKYTFRRAIRPPFSLIWT